jgi:hypothetical protein
VESKNLPEEGLLVMTGDIVEPLLGGKVEDSVNERTA